eukprot:gene5980-6676_t
MNEGHLNSHTYSYNAQRQQQQQYNNGSMMLDQMFDDMDYIAQDDNISQRDYNPNINAYDYQQGDYNNAGSDYQLDAMAMGNRDNYHLDSAQGENYHDYHDYDSKNYQDRNQFGYLNNSGNSQGFNQAGANIILGSNARGGYQNQKNREASPFNDYNGFSAVAASSESSFASLCSPKRQYAHAEPPQQEPLHQEQPPQVNGILEMEGSVEPNGPILGGQGYIPAQTVQKGYYELGETPEIKAACLRGLRQQIDIHQEENNFDEHSDAFLLKFLRSRKFDVEAAYTLLEKYYNVRESKPEVFRNLTRKNVKRTMEQGIVGVLPQRDKKGRAILTFNFNGWNMSLPFHFEKLLRVFVFTLEKLFESEETQINGIVIISNLAQLSVLQTKNLGASMITKILEIFEGNLPFRLNAIHLLNPPWHFKLLWKMVDPLTKMKPKIARRIFIHDGDLSRFQAEFEPGLLPKDLGGTSPPYDNKLWVKEILGTEQDQATTQPPQTQQQRQMKTLQPSSSASNSRRSPSPARRQLNK